MYNVQCTLTQIHLLIMNIKGEYEKKTFTHLHKYYSSTINSTNHSHSRRQVFEKSARNFHEQQKKFAQEMQKIHLIESNERRYRKV